MVRDLQEQFETEFPLPAPQAGPEEIQTWLGKRTQLEQLARMARGNLEGLEQLRLYFFEHCNQE